MFKKVARTQFVTRQTADSPFSHFAMPAWVGSPQERDWRVLCSHLEECLDEPEKLGVVVKPGYRDGVVLIDQPYSNVDGLQFFSGVVNVTPETELSPRFAPRRPGELPFVDVLAVDAQKPEAVAVEFVLYSRDLLAADGDAVDADYGIVSINARLCVEPEPMHPIAMMRNQLALPGGTKAEYSSEQWAASTLFWSTRVMSGRKEVK
jgi:hypothetical protein